MRNSIYNLLEGMASLSPFYHPSSRYRARSDAAALRDDWEKVGQDLRFASEQSRKKK